MGFGGIIVIVAKQEPEGLLLIIIDSDEELARLKRSHKEVGTKVGVQNSSFSEFPQP